jgi:hypothetical protein
MSGIVLSASVRQNLLSLQSTAALLATTQNDLATGNAVNSALDNPTSYFTAQSLNNRASDINNLLDGIGNGVQVLQAANTGITSLQSLVSNAQSIANQVLQTRSAIDHEVQCDLAPPWAPAPPPRPPAPSTCWELRRRLPTSREAPSRLSTSRSRLASFTMLTTSMTVTPAPAALSRPRSPRGRHRLPRPAILPAGR